MDRLALESLLRSVQAGELGLEEALAELHKFPFETLGQLKIDSHRALRTGQAEVIYSPGKTTEELLSAIGAINAQGADALATRVEPGVARALKARCSALKYHERARCAVSYLREDCQPSVAPLGKVGVICAGASDLPVAEEAKLTCEVLGARAELVSDVGVAGIHRLKSAEPTMHESDCLIVIAGMEGALASVVTGLSAKPVIAVPTSTGYGASFGGVAALLGMLNSCAPGMAVVNIDNGYGAGALATRIARQSFTAQPAADSDTGERSKKNELAGG